MRLKNQRKNTLEISRCQFEKSHFVQQQQKTEKKQIERFASVQKRKSKRIQVKLIQTEKTCGGE